MADQPISALATESTPLANTGVFPIVHDPSGTPVTKKVALSVLDYRHAKVFSVKEYGALGNNSADDTTAIQAAIDAAHANGGGVVHFPAAIYKITAALNLYSSITLQGEGMEATVIQQYTLNQNGLHGSDISSLCLYDITIQGNGTGSNAGTGTGIGVHLDWSAAGNNPFHNFRNVRVTNWGAEGIKIRTPIVCTFQKVYSSYNATHGFNWYEGGTSCNFQNCWARQNGSAGYRFDSSVYQSLTGCAADNNGTNYMVLNAQSIGFFGCGSEGALRNGGLFDGFGWYIDNSSVIKLSSCWVTDNRNLGVWVTNGSNDVAIQAADNTPHASPAPTNFITVDVGCNATIYELHNTTANSLLGVVLIINDGAGAIQSSDHLVLKAGTNKLTKIAALRQDDTTNTYKNGNTVILTGWGVLAQGAAASKTESITFGITFAQRPIVLATFGGDNANVATTYGSGGNNSKGPVCCKAHTILTTGFTVHVHTADGTSWAATDNCFYQWIAIGEL